MPFFDHGLCDRCAGGFESLCDGHEKGKASIAGGLSNQWWAMRDVACGFAARSRFGPTALACCAGKRLRVSSAPHPVGFESLCDGPKKRKAPIAGSLSNQWWAMRDSNPQPCACKAPALTVAPIAPCGESIAKQSPHSPHIH